MPKKIIYLLMLMFFMCFVGFSQQTSVNSIDSHETFVKLLGNSKDVKYQEIINLYDAYIKRYPNDIKVQVYKCKFIGSAYYDEYEDYNLKYEETEVCLNNLYNLYPKNPYVLVYKIENSYGDDREALLSTAIQDIEENNAWTDKLKGNLYELASYYYNDVDDSKVVTYGEMAQKLNDSLDLSVMISRAHLNQGDTDYAKATMRKSLSRNLDAWDLKNKADFLVEIGEHDEALEMFDRANEKDSTLTSNGSLYEIFLEQKKYDIAREYLVKDTLYEWNRVEKIQNLFKHDLEYSDPDVAMLSYRRLQEASFYDDFFGIKRLKLFFKAPLLRLSFDDFLHFFILIVFIVGLFLVPYLWILPIYAGAKLAFKNKNPDESEAKPYWNLKHFWICSFFYLLIQFLLVLVFYYENYINYYFDVVTSYVDETVLETDADLANGLLIYMTLIFVSTLFFLNKRRLKYVLSTNLGFIQMILKSIGFVILNMILLKILGSFVDLSDMSTLIKELSARVEIKALLSEYGIMPAILMVALIGPFYEEVIFRGIVLSSTRNRLGFVWANIIQAFLFAVVHFNLSLFVFYFVFGLITGHMAKKTNGLLTSFFFHAINNLFVVLVLYMTMKLTSAI